jgi:elongation factor G
VTLPLAPHNDQPPPPSLADSVEDVDEIGAGGIGAVVGLRSSRTGDSLVASGLPGAVTLDGLTPPPPVSGRFDGFKRWEVFSKAVEAATAAEEEGLAAALEFLQREDPVARFSRWIDV